MKSGNLNFLEPSGPLQACTLYIYIYKKCVCKYASRQTMENVQCVPVLVIVDFVVATEDKFDDIP